MDIAVQDFNISLFMDPGSNPLRATITEMNIWEEGPSVSAIGKTSSASPTQSSIGRPFLAKLTINDFKHGKCFATVIHFNSWRRVIPIFEEESYVVFILEPSRPARVSSILIFQQLEPNILDIEFLKQANSKTGLAGDSFVRTYFEKVLGFETQNIEDGSSEYKYDGKFRSINGTAASLELPDGKVFLSQHRKQFVAGTPTYFYEGFSFAFNKGSPMATDVSRDILNLYEDGTLRSLEENRFAYSGESSAYLSDRTWLLLPSFWGIHLIFGATSTLCLLLFLINLIRSYCCGQDETEDNLSPC